MDVAPSNHISSADTIRRSISTLNLSYTNPGLKVRASISFTNGANDFGKQHLEEKNESNSSDENPLDNHVFYIWTKQINNVEPFMVFKEMLTYQGRRYSESDIAPVWKKDCRMWLWKTKHQKISKKVNRKLNKILKNIQQLNVKVHLSKGEPDIMDLLNCLQNLRLNS